MLHSSRYASAPHIPRACALKSPSSIVHRPSSIIDVPEDPVSGTDLRWPAEWEPVEAIWLSWPHRADLWDGSLRDLEERFVALAREISPHAEVRINADASLHPHLSSLLPDVRCRLYNHPTNDVWCRDHGAIFVRRNDGGLQVADWQFNAWGGQFPPWELDNAIPRRMAESLALPRQESSLVLEGGAIEGNGEGLLLTTEAVLLNPNRNPDATKQAVEAELLRMMGTTHVFWLDSGIEGDDTGGHIDDMVRFVRSDAAVAVTETNPHSPHYFALAENHERLEDLRTPSRSSVEIIPLPMPDPLIRRDWRLEQLPASYANFLICNNLVLVPTFDQPKNDDRALGILRECFPHHQVRGFDARLLLIEGGAIHCVTQQQPALVNET